jgi:hypothetical protein
MFKLNLSHWITNNLILLFFLSLARLAFFYEFSDAEIYFFNQKTFMAFFIGIRFDLMVLGFCNFVYLILKVFLNLFSLSFLDWLYWSLLLILISLTIALDHSHYGLFKNRLTAESLYKTQIDSYQLGLWLVLAVLVSFSFLFKQLYSLRKSKSIHSSQSKNRYWILALLLSGLCARSSLGPQHIDLRTAQFSDQFFLNTLAINSPYAIDQSLKKRR